MSVVPNRDRQAERRAATRREIVEAAWIEAQEVGLATLTLRSVAARVGMQAPSLYSHFASKNAIYDAMFADAWTQCTEAIEQWRTRITAKTTPRQRLLIVAESFFDFAVVDPARNQLMNERVVPDFTPSAEAYAASLACYEELVVEFTAIGITRPEDLDLYTALLSGFISQQLANDLGGDRWRRQLDRLMDMFADEVGLPGPALRRAPKKGSR